MTKPSHPDPTPGSGRDPGPAPEKLADGVARGERRDLARAITLIESRLPADKHAADRLLALLLPKSGRSQRIGITGVPGVGKSTFIEALGIHLVEKGHRVAVLAVDPSSSISGGSILGDKSRMHSLAQRDDAFIRPSPAAGSLGGVARRTRETMILCEAAGYDVIIVETVGVGQSETVVADMVDLFLVLMLPGAGDELQGIKRGVLELADIVAVNKADGDLLPLARIAQSEYASALRYMHGRSEDWTPVATTVSARTGQGVPELWAQVEKHRAALQASGGIERRRQEQRRRWLWSLLEETLLDRFRNAPQVRGRFAEIENEVISGVRTPEQGVEALLALWSGAD